MHHWIELAVWVMPSHTHLQNEAIALRLVHFLAGITWVGLLYFFNLVNVPFMKTVDAAAKPKILEHMTLPALNFFRWSALLTVCVGVWYWSEAYVAVDSKLNGGSIGGTIGLFFLVWIAAWWIFYFFIKKVPNPWLLVVVVIVLVCAAGWTFVNYTPVGQDDNHVLVMRMIGAKPTYLLALSKKDGRTIFDGAVMTDEQRQSVPTEVSDSFEMVVRHPETAKEFGAEDKK
jgi:apolipoprotein N-acyltransferase